MFFKGCARCRGDLFQENDVGHTDLVCLQCGYRRTIDSDLIEASRKDKMGLMRRMQTQ